MQKRTWQMPIRTPKLILLGCFGLAVVVYSFIGQRVAAFSGGPPASRTGAPALGTVPLEPTCTLCHTSFALNSGPGVLTVSGLPFTYSPGQEVTVTVTLTQAERVRYGFETAVLDDQGRRAGDFVVTDTARMRTIDGTGNYNGRQYIQHITAGTNPTGPNQGSWSFTWRAPAQNAGRVTFFIAGNAANGANGNQGDYIYNISRSVQPAGGLPVASAASFVATGSLGVESIASIFGAGLADDTAAAPGLPLPTTLAGATLKVKDAAGMERNAPLFFASANQINFLIPAGTGAGVATLTVLRGNNIAGTSAVLIESVAPGLFAANANGQGVAAAVALRVRGNAQTIEPVVQFNAATNRVDPLPIDLGPEGDQVFLVLFGSGFRGRSGTNNRALIGGTDATVQFAGAQGDLAGLDQTNLLIPRSLAGRGNVDIGLTVDNRRANLVTVNIK